jgi:hypothetical protein
MAREPFKGPIRLTPAGAPIESAADFHHTLSKAFVRAAKVSDERYGGAILEGANDRVVAGVQQLVPLLHSLIESGPSFLPGFCKARTIVKAESEPNVFEAADEKHYESHHAAALGVLQGFIDDLTCQVVDEAGNSWGRYEVEDPLISRQGNAVFWAQVFDAFESFCIKQMNAEFANLVVGEPSHLTSIENQSHAPAQVSSLSGLPEVNLDLNQVRYNGECHDVRSDGALLMSKLVEAYPHPFPANSLFSKPSNVKNKLPEGLRVLIEAKSGTGYRLKLN